MRCILLIFICSISFLGIAQDSLFFKNGTVKAVEIIEMDSLANLVGYVYESDTVYTSINFFERILYKGKITSSDLLQTAVIIKAEKAKEAARSKAKPNPKYRYGKWAVSTNLTGMIEMNKRFAYVGNRVFSLEPEYFINDRFSVKMPLHIGMVTENEQGSSSYSPYEMNSDNPDDLPFVQELDTWRTNQLGHKRDLLFQIGLNPKYFFKGQRTLGWYLSQGFYVAQINLNRVDYYYDYERYTNNSGNIYWNRPNAISRSFEEKRWVFHYEGGIGVSINVLRGLGLTGEFGYTSLIKSENQGVDQVFIREEEGEYILDPFLVQHSPNYRLSQSFKPYTRLHLLYRFGGVKNVSK